MERKLSILGSGPSDRTAAIHATRDETLWSLATDGVFIAIVHSLPTEIFAKQLTLKAGATVQPSPR